jgi:ParB/RepB/Spo0J family partition protein
MDKDEWVDIPVNTIGESYGRYRLIYPGSEVTVLESMRQFGQILPVVVVAGLESFELIDGFKRLRASRKLGLKTIQAKVLSLDVPPLKAAILQLNWKARSIREVEEALIVQSLHREDKLSQVEIGLLLRRHKSWLSRRIALVEKLSDEVLTHLKLGLISAGHGRELTRLPRGNQERALATVLKHRLSCRETERLASMLLERPGWEHEAILNLPLEILNDRSAPRRRVDLQPCMAQRFRDFKQICHGLTLALDACDLEPLTPRERESALPVIEELETLLDRIRKALNT